MSIKNMTHNDPYTNNRFGSFLAMCYLSDTKVCKVV